MELRLMNRQNKIVFFGLLLVIIEYNNSLELELI